MTSFSELSTFYSQATHNLERHFAEQRQNILLNAGFHYANRSRFHRIRGLPGIEKDKKIRITKNHIQRICKRLKNTILEAGMDVGVYPKNENEMSDQKAAELHSSVWSDIADDQNFDCLKGQIVEDFVVCGEAIVKVYYDPNKGDLIRYDQDTDDLGNPLGSPIPVFTGSICFERVFPFNVLTGSEKSWEECLKVGVKKLFPTSELKAKFKGDTDKLKLIDDVADTYQIFDGLTGTYSDTKDHTQVTEIYCRPSAEHPKGYYYYMTSTGILEEGPLHRWPLVYMGFDEHPTSARSYSIIKQLRPFQVEINRCASNIIVESVTLGSSTVISQAGTKLSTDNIGNGLKRLSYTGPKPDVIPGRNGEQYVEYMNSMISEMYQIADIEEHEKEKPSYSNDTMSMLYRSIRDKRKFVIYASKIQRGFKKICETALDLAQAYLPDEAVIPMVGRNEVVNIDEFRSASSISRIIKVQARDESFEETMGRSINISQILQYAGSSLSPEQLGILARNLPFLNKEGLLDSLTLNYDIARNVVLQLDRGKIPTFNENEDHTYMLNFLNARSKRSDWDLLPEEIRQNFQQRIMMHQQTLSDQQQQAQMASSGYIPSGGGLVGVDMYIPDEQGKQKRLRLPFESIGYLLKALEAQGTSKASIDSMELPQKALLGQQLNQSLPTEEEFMSSQGQDYGQFDNF